MKHLERIHGATWKAANVPAALTADHLHLKNKQEPTDIQWLSNPHWPQFGGPGYFRKILNLWDKRGQLSKYLGGCERLNLFTEFIWVRVDLA